MFFDQLGYADERGKVGTDRRQPKISLPKTGGKSVSGDFTKIPYSYENPPDSILNGLKAYGIQVNYLYVSDLIGTSYVHYFNATIVVPITISDEKIRIILKNILNPFSSAISDIIVKDVLVTPSSQNPPKNGELGINLPPPPPLNPRFINDGRSSSNTGYTPPGRGGTYDPSAGFGTYPGSNSNVIVYPNSLRPPPPLNSSGNNIFQTISALISQGIQGWAPRASTQVGTSPTVQSPYSDTIANSAALAQALNPPPRPPYVDPTKTPGDAAKTGIDGIITWVTANPLIVLLGVGGVYLLMKEPPRGRR